MTQQAIGVLPECVKTLQVNGRVGMPIKELCIVLNCENCLKICNFWISHFSTKSPISTFLNLLEYIIRYYSLDIFTCQLDWRITTAKPFSGIGLDVNNLKVSLINSTFILARTYQFPACNDIASKGRLAKICHEPRR